MQKTIEIHLPQYEIQQLSPHYAPCPAEQYGTAGCPSDPYNFHKLSIVRFQERWNLMRKGAHLRTQYLGHK